MPSRIEILLIGLLFALVAVPASAQLGLLKAIGKAAKKGADVAGEGAARAGKNVHRAIPNDIPEGAPTTAFLLHQDLDVQRSAYITRNEAEIRYVSVDAGSIVRNVALHSIDDLVLAVAKQPQEEKENEEQEKKEGKKKQEVHLFVDEILIDDVRRVFGDLPAHILLYAVPASDPMKYRSLNAKTVFPDHPPPWFNFLAFLLFVYIFFLSMCLIVALLRRSLDPLRWGLALPGNLVRAPFYALRRKLLA